MEYVERGKSRNLVELLANRNLLPRGNVPSTVLNQLERLRREIGMEQRRLDVIDQRRFRSRIPRNSESFEPSEDWFSDRTHLNQLQQQLESLIQQEIHPYDPTFSLTQQVKPIAFEQIQQLLPNKQTALIEWYFTDEALLAFLIIPHRSTPLVCQSSLEDWQALEQWGNRYLTAYTSNKQQWQVELSDRLHKLAEILHLDSLLFMLPEDCLQLILIPHRFLHLLPLHALPLPTNSQKFLLDRFPQGVQYAPSCQLLQLTQVQHRRDFSHFFAIQNPTQDLNYTDIEVATIRRSFQPHDNVLVHQNATKEAISPVQAYQAHCAHFSCHGYFNFESPLQSALLLADSKVSTAPADHNPSRYLPLPDGTVIDLSKCLTLDDLFNQTLDLRQCRLVSLSACETNQIDFTSLSDEYIGLPSGFLYAGSSSVVGSLWAVNDLSTAILMIKFYESFQPEPKPTVAVALNQAQLWLRDVTGIQLKRWISDRQVDISQTFKTRWLNKIQDNDQPFRSAYHWAAFCAIGQ